MVSKTLFDPAPKDDPRFLYGRDRELAELVSLLAKGEWAVLMGPRRVGKTSLALSAATSMKIPTIVVDSRIDADLSRSLTVQLSKNVRTVVGGNISVPHGGDRPLLFQGVPRPYPRFPPFQCEEDTCDS
jgi:Predicted ATPase (AAA+ superfamily)